MKQKKQLVRLTEGDLHRIIKESVNKVLNENEDWYSGNEADRDVQMIRDRVQYMSDKELEKILNGTSKYDNNYFDSDDDDNGDYRFGIIFDAAEEEYAKRHKDYAMKLYSKKYNQIPYSYEKEYPSDENKNVRPDRYNRYNKFSENYWFPQERLNFFKNKPWLFKRHGDWIKRNSEWLSNPEMLKLMQRISKEVYPLEKSVADKRPLHRKGSLNRELMKMDKQKNKK